MKFILITITLLTIKLSSFSQKKDINEIAITNSIIWNRTTIFNSYSGGRAKDLSGNASSFGSNVNYTKSIYKSIFAKIGIGYFKQKFGIVRPFDFDETIISSGLLYSTKFYKYKNLNYFFGLGYSYSLPKNYNLRFNINYNLYNSFQQEFKHTLNNHLGNINPQIRKENYYFGQSLNLSFGSNKSLNKSFSVGCEILLPIYNRWKKDEIFRENINEFYGSDYSIGASINLIYSLNKK